MRTHSVIRPLFCMTALFVPATSAPVERAFYQEGLLMKPHRAKMSDSMLELLMSLHCDGNWSGCASGLLIHEVHGMFMI